MVEHNLEFHKIIRLLPMRFFTMGHANRNEFIKILLNQFYFTFNQSILILISLGGLVGLAFSVQAGFGAMILGSDQQIGSILVFIIWRELAPLATILLLIARSVTAVASEISTMKVGPEIDALNVLGINTFDYLWGPRIIAAILSLFCMSIVFFVAASAGYWLGGNLISYFPISQLIRGFAKAISSWDVIFFILKTTIPGGLVFYLACRRATSIGTSRHEVPIATNRAVVDALFMSLIFQFIMSAIFYTTVGF